jgi:hypothetical protein
MGIMLRAAIAALSFASIHSAQAGEGERAAAIGQFIQVPGVAGEAPVSNAASVATGQNRQAIRPYVAASIQGTWLFANGRFSTAGKQLIALPG